MKFCHQCGYNLQLGTEIFCPNCGYSLQIRQQKNNSIKDHGIKGIVHGIDIRVNNTGGDVIGSITRTGMLGGKDVEYTVNGNIINFQIGGDISNQSLEQLQKLLTISPQLDSSLDSGEKFDREKNQTKLEESSEASNQIKQVLADIEKLEAKDVKIKEIKFGDLQISKDELSSKELILKGNEHFYKQEYNQSIIYYDQVLQLDKNNFDVLFNKAFALCALGQYHEALEWYDKALEIKPDDDSALYNKGLALYNLGQYKEAIEWYDKALMVKPDHANALYNKGLALYNLGQYKEAIEWYDKALEIDPNHANAKSNKQIAEKT